MLDSLINRAQMRAHLNKSILHKKRRKRRHTQRWKPSVTLYVCGYAVGHYPFSEPACVVEVNENGAQLQLISPVHVGQKLVLVNAATMEDEDCQVVHVDEGNEERVTVAVRFKSRKSGFWNSKGMTC